MTATPAPAQRRFLEQMHRDPYFHDDLVDKGEHILRDLCRDIEANEPEDLDALYVLSHAATERFNALQEEFLARDSDIETAAREEIATEFERIAHAHGLTDADIEELTAPREW